MNILVVCKLADHTLKENVLLPLLSSEKVSHIFVLRDRTGDELDGRVTYLCPGTLQESKLRHFWKVWRGMGAVKKYKIEAIIGVLNTPHGYIGRAIGFLTRTSYIHMTIAGHREFWMYGPRVERLNLWAFGSGTAITVTGSQTRNYLISKGVSENKIFLLPNLPNEIFTKVPVKTVRHYDIVSFSRIDRNKNVILLVKALARIKDERPQLRVAIAGDGDQLENIKQATQRYGLTEIIDFLGYVSDINDKIRLLSDSKLFVSCSKGEGFPVSLLEAMNCGCVPVVSNVGDIVDVIHSGENGYIFDDTDDETEFTSCLLRLLGNDDAISNFRLEAYKIKDNISVINNGKIWNSVFDICR